MVHFDMAALAPSERYKLLTGVVVPRPIAWITTISPDGTVNAAPFSYFNVMGSDPPVIVIGVGDREGEAKDTARNIALTRELVVNVVNEETVIEMNVSAGDYPYGVDELAKAGLTPIPSVRVRPPRIAESPVHLECTELQTLEIRRTRIIVAEVVGLHIRGDLIDVAKFRVHGEQLGAVGRMHGRGWYTRTRDLFELVRPRIAGKEPAGG
ncbi:MAG TPA: flavin reductase family protein [Gemmatimonadaceae bacterium]|nr:flavin reductase family protein [Gemmatimonadaceae bacterium]